MTKDLLIPLNSWLMFYSVVKNLPTFPQEICVTSGDNGIFLAFLRKSRTQNISWNLLRRTYFAIHTYKHAGDIPAASILERCSPPSGTADISLFVYKSFAVMLSTSSNWSVESEEAVFAQCRARAQRGCHCSEGREREEQKSEKGGATSC